MFEIDALKVMAGFCYVHVTKSSCLEKDHQRLWVGVLNCEICQQKILGDKTIWYFHKHSELFTVWFYEKQTTEWRNCKILTIC